MDTVDQQNTEFSVETPVVVVTPVRCDEGKRLIRTWVKAYNENVRTNPGYDESWHDVLFGEYGTYINHVAVCPDCTKYELARFARYK